MHWSTCSPQQRLSYLQDQAERWSNPDCDLRVEAVERILDQNVRLTDEELAFAINQAMVRLREMTVWPISPSVSPIGIFRSPAHPTALLDLVSLAMGFGVDTWVDSGSTLSPIVELWLADAPDEASSHIREQPFDEWPPLDLHVIYGEVDDKLAADAPESQDGSSSLNVPVHQFGIAIIDGNESADEREGIAEDALLFLGSSSRTAQLIWAKEGIAPDAYLEAFAAFRGVFPAHAELAGSLEMNRAFLEAQDLSHAYAEDLSFLLSKGKPELQQPGHVRWVPFKKLREVESWVQQRSELVSYVSRREELAGHMTLNVAEGAPGSAHRPGFLQIDGGDPLIKALT